VNADDQTDEVTLDSGIPNGILFQSDGLRIELEANGITGVDVKPSTVHSVLSYIGKAQGKGQGNTEGRNPHP
jgi:hypothetical protein